MCLYFVADVVLIGPSLQSSRLTLYSFISHFKSNGIIGSVICQILRGRMRTHSYMSLSCPYYYDNMLSGVPVRDRIISTAHDVRLSFDSAIWLAFSHLASCVAAYSYSCFQLDLQGVEPILCVCE